MDLPKFFRIYLISQGCSPLTVKNYLSDVKNFFDWLAQKTGIHYQVAGKAIFGIFTKETILEYQQDLLSAKTPPSTINRHLSALRKLGEFARNQGWLSENPAVKISNVTAGQYYFERKHHLERGGFWAFTSGVDKRSEGSETGRLSTESSAKARRTLPELTDLLGDFRKYLEKEKTSPLTIKNYLSDVRHFLGWLEGN
jgi:site-specific recombinase XerD